MFFNIPKDRFSIKFFDELTIESLFLFNKNVEASIILKL